MGGGKAARGDRAALRHLVACALPLLLSAVALSGCFTLVGGAVGSGIDSGRTAIEMRPIAHEDLEPGQRVKLEIDGADDLEGDYQAHRTFHEPSLVIRVERDTGASDFREARRERDWQDYRVSIRAVQATYERIEHRPNTGRRNGLAIGLVADTIVLGWILETVLDRDFAGPGPPW